LRALMRQDYRYFSNNSGFVANIFNCDSRWKRPNNVLLSEILFYLVEQRKTRGDNGQMGCVAITRLVSDMESLGFVKEDVIDAAQFCLAKELIEVDTSSPDTIRDRDSVKATASGWAHIRLLSSRIEYIASVLPTTPMNDKQLSARVYDLMLNENRTGRTQFHQSVQIVQSFESYLRRQIRELSVHPGYADRKRSGSHYVLNKVQEALAHARRDAAKQSGQPDLLDI